jgi:hypothetical protein
MCSGKYQSIFVIGYISLCVREINHLTLKDEVWPPGKTGKAMITKMLIILLALMRFIWTAARSSLEKIISTDGDRGIYM